MCSSEVLVMPVIKRSKMQNFIFLWKMWSKIRMDSFYQKKRLASNETLNAAWTTFRGKTFTVRWKMYTAVIDESCTHRLSSKTSTYTTFVTNTANYSQFFQKKILPDEFSTFQQRDIITTFQNWINCTRFSV